MIIVQPIPIQMYLFLNRVEILRRDLELNCTNTINTDSEGDFTTESEGLILSLKSLIMSLKRMLSLFQRDSEKPDLTST